MENLPYITNRISPPYTVDIWEDVAIEQLSENQRKIYYMNNFQEEREKSKKVFQQKKSVYFLVCFTRMLPF